SGRKGARPQNQLSAYAAESSKPKEDVFIEGKKEGFAADREVGHVEGQKEGFRARDFVKSSSFQVVVEIKFVEFFNKGFSTCKAQLNTLGGFAKNFDQELLKPMLYGQLQPYPGEPAPGDDEFLTLLDEIEPLK
ncbi:UNVERIFIED_CONTAM: hypothetical protein Sindi_0472800, partial [Sesamum indicum]